MTTTDLPTTGGGRALTAAVGLWLLLAGLACVRLARRWPQPVPPG